MSKEVDGTKIKTKKTWKDYKQNFKKRLLNVKQHTIKRWKENKKKIIIRYAVFLSIFLITYFLDQFTKFHFYPGEAAYEAYENGNIVQVYQGAFLGIRLVPHHGVTIIPFKTNAVIIIVQIISVISILTFTILIFYIDSFLWVSIIAMLVSGTAGNMTDRFLWNGYVKDILFWTYFEKVFKRDLGTFNVADVLIIVSIIISVVYLVISIFVEYFKEEKQKIDNPNNQNDINNNDQIVSTNNQHNTVS
ncbi:signal peptidase II [Mycoplasmopsis phocirhinis]|uniref:Signal peptidase II n=1 Tax=Mycoplasmopsis phocirhinis TaxID=142650 RepID=A0A4P6MSQ1_9BACT|nr:signal peptidase II [Mycoplasmopsis phocirhinis]QBF34901.1 signal peptidase II [Mycoplasmopsis phocirhinis]